MINLKLRFKNKATLVALITATIAFIYQLAGIAGFAVPISQDSMVQLAGVLINLLVAMGILVDPTTSGIADSTKALGYNEPKKEE